MSNGSTDPRCYVSYAWADEGDPNREAQVDALCKEAKTKGIEIVRDKDALKAGDRISEFMRKIGGSDRVFVFLSNKYLTSPFCMNELFQMWKNSREDPKDFLGRVRLFTLDDAKFGQIADRIKYAKYWQSEHDKLAEIVRDSPNLLSEADFRSFRLMDEFATNIGDILALFSDTVRPRSFEEFLKCGFDDPEIQRPPPSPPPPIKPTEQPVKPDAPKRSLAPVLAVLLAIVAIGGGWLAWRNWHNTPFPNPFPQISDVMPSINKAQYSVPIQFAGYNRPDMQKLADKLAAQNWNVQPDLDRQTSAAGLSEVRYRDTPQKTAAEALAADINATKLLNTQVKARAFGIIQPNVHEIWIGQR